MRFLNCVVLFIGSSWSSWSSWFILIRCTKRKRIKIHSLDTNENKFKQIRTELKWNDKRQPNRSLRLRLGNGIKNCAKSYRLWVWFGISWDSIKLFRIYTDFNCIYKIVNETWKCDLNYLFTVSTSLMQKNSRKIAGCFQRIKWNN